MSFNMQQVVKVPVCHGLLGEISGADVGRVPQEDEVLVVSSVVGMVEGSPVLVGVPTVVVGTVGGVVFEMGVPGEAVVVPKVDTSGPGVLP